MHLSKKYADKVFKEITDLEISCLELKRKEEYLFKYIAGIVLGNLTFVDKLSVGSVQRWWHDFINEVS